MDYQDKDSHPQFWMDETLPKEPRMLKTATVYDGFAAPKKHLQPWDILL